MSEDRLAVSVEMNADVFRDLLDASKLIYRVFTSRRRSLFLTDYLPEPVSLVTASFLHRTILPEMLLEHLDEEYDDLEDEERQAVFQENLPVIEKEDFQKGTQAALRSNLEEQKGMSIKGWLRFRGEGIFRPMVAELSRAALRDLRLRRAYQQFRSLHQQPADHLCLIGRGERLVVTDADGRPMYREFLEGYLDDRLDIAREDLARKLVQALKPESIRLVDVDPELERWIRQSMPEALA